MNVSLDDADEYFLSRLNSESWFELTEAQKQAAISMAEDRINGLPFIGTQVSKTQSKPFPRYFKCEVLQIPDDVVKAVFEEAFSLVYKKDNLSSDVPQNVSSVSLGSASVSFKNNGSSFLHGLSGNTLGYLEKWLKKGFDAEMSGFREVY